jgi:cytoskeleton protein RodZ
MVAKNKIKSKDTAKSKAKKASAKSKTKSKAKANSQTDSQHSNIATSLPLMDEMATEDKSIITEDSAEKSPEKSPGMRLYELRIAQGFTIPDVAKKLKIKANLLEDMEHDRLDKELQHTHLRGFYRSYAKFLGCDAHDFMRSVSDYTETEAKRYALNNPQHVEHQAKYGKIFIILSLLVMIGLLLYWNRQELAQYELNDMTLKSEIASEETSESVEHKQDQVPIIEEVSPEITEATEEITQEAIIEDTIIENAITTIETSQDEVSQDEASQNIVEETEEIIEKIEEVAPPQISLTAKQDLWLLLEDSNDNIIFEGILNQGQNIALEQNQEYMLSTNNAGALFLSDGNNPNAQNNFGDIGQVIDQQHIILP